MSPSGKKSVDAGGRNRPSMANYFSQGGWEDKTAGLDYLERNKHILSCADSTAADGAEALFLDRPLSDCGKCHSESEENLHLRISCLVLHRGSGWGVNGKGHGDCGGGKVQGIGKGGTVKKAPEAQDLPKEQRIIYPYLPERNRLRRALPGRSHMDGEKGVCL